MKPTNNNFTVGQYCDTITNYQLVSFYNIKNILLSKYDKDQRLYVYSSDSYAGIPSLEEFKSMKDLKNLSDNIYSANDIIYWIGNEETPTRVYSLNPIYTFKEEL